MKKVVFAGFGNLGLICLKELISQKMEIELVLTHRDNTEGSVDYFCNQNKLSVHYSDLRKDNQLYNYINNKSFDYLISVNYRYIIPEEILQKSKYPLNLHGALLPKYRGRTPHVWSIINGEKKSGVTCHLMEQTVDTGKIYDQLEISILPDDTGFTLLKKFEELYPLCLRNTLLKIRDGFTPIEQNENEATYFGKRIPEMGYIDFTKDIDSTINFIRAQARPYPGAYCFLSDGRRLVVHKAEIINVEQNISALVGRIMKYKNGYLAKFNNGYILFSDYEIKND